MTTGMRVGAMLAAALGLSVVGQVADAASPAQTCQAGKNKEAGRYANCRYKAEAKLATRGDLAAHQLALERCTYKLAVKWPLLESKAGGACPSTADQAAIQGLIDTHTSNVATALAGTGTLMDCPADLATCEGDLTTCNQGLTACEGDFAACQALPQGQRLQTGQALCWDPADTTVPIATIACAGITQDGGLQKGLARAYADNGDGTITDMKTGLMWEKLSDDGSIHDKDNQYTWANAFTKVASLNAGGGFAGHTDWRVPNVNELQSLANYGAVSPAVSPVFNTGCVASCTVTTCSCTQSYIYWSSTTTQRDPDAAWNVYFVGGDVLAYAKTNSFYVRAVRSGT